MSYLVFRYFVVYVLNMEARFRFSSRYGLVFAVVLFFNVMYIMLIFFMGGGNSPVSSSLWPRIKEVKTYFLTGLASIWSNKFTNSNEKKTCLLLCLFFILKFQTLTCRTSLVTKQDESQRRGNYSNSPRIRTWVLRTC